MRQTIHFWCSNAKTNNIFETIFRVFGACFNFWLCSTRKVSGEHYGATICGICLRSYYSVNRSKIEIFLPFPNKMKKYFRKKNHIFAHFRAYPWEYQPDNVVHDIKNHSVPSSFQLVLTTYEENIGDKSLEQNLCLRRT